MLSHIEVLASSQNIAVVRRYCGAVGPWRVGKMVLWYAGAVLSCFLCVLIGEMFSWCSGVSVQ